MMKKFLLAAPLALAAGALLASPASAASFSNPGQIRGEIQQLDRQVDRTRGLSGREEQRLQNQVDRLQDLYRSFARDGFSRGELQRLDRELTAVKMQVFQQSRDGNRSNRDNRSDHDDRRDQRHDHRR
jgi:TolA-binding protein